MERSEELLAKERVIRLMFILFNVINLDLDTKSMDFLLAYDSMNNEVVNR